MDQTPNIGLPYIMAAQAQKHVTHNEAIRALDAILHLAVRDQDQATPPASPADGDRYIVAAPATGAWSGHEHEIAAFQDGAWMFYPPREGWIAWLEDDDAAVVWDGSSWLPLAAGGGGGPGPDPALLGINATADINNRLAVSSPASLFSHEGDGHQLKINKAMASATASLLYQTGFSGRAEMGLTGDDDFHFKVSADGTTWNEAIVIARNTGAVTFPNTAPGGGGRQLLTGPRTYHVNVVTGSDTNTGLTSGAAFATIQKAIDTAANLDTGIHDVTIQIAPGTYTAPVNLKPLSGAGRCHIVGNEANPSSVIISLASGTCFNADSVYSIYHLRGMHLQTAAGGYGIKATGHSKIYYRSMNFGACTNGHIYAENGGSIEADGDYSISGGGAYHWLVSAGTIQVVGRTITLTGTPVFGSAGSQAFASGLRTGAIITINNTFSGSAMGRRYLASGNGLIDTNGAGASALPGSAAGSTVSGGEYN